MFDFSLLQTRIMGRIHSSHLQSEMGRHSIPGAGIQYLAVERGRLLSRKPKGLWQDTEQRLIGAFKARARLHIGTLPDESNLVGWLSLMQHYTAPTRLLDWTESPFAATWFAYSEAREDNDELCSVWAMHARVCREQFGTRTPGGRDNLRLTDPEMNVTDPVEEENYFLRRAITEEGRWPVLIMPISPDRRMVAQQGLLRLTGR